MDYTTKFLDICEKIFQKVYIPKPTELDILLLGIAPLNCRHKNYLGWWCHKYFSDKPCPERAGNPLRGQDKYKKKSKNKDYLVPSDNSNAVVNTGRLNWRARLSKFYKKFIKKKKNIEWLEQIYNEVQNDIIVPMMMYIVNNCSNKNYQSEITRKLGLDKLESFEPGRKHFIAKELLPCP